MRLLLLLAALGLASSAHAGTVATYVGQKQEPPLRIEIADNGDLRVGDNDRFYSLRLGGVSYLVMRTGKGWEVARLADVVAAFDRTEPKRAPGGSPPSDAAIRFEPLGPAVVNGRSGTAYRVQGVEMRSSSDYAISHDPALASVGDGVRLAVERSIVMAYPFVSERMAPAIRRLFALGTLLEGELGGDVYRLDRVESADVDPARLKLPARPLGVEDIVRRMSEGR